MRSNSRYVVIVLLFAVSVSCGVLGLVVKMGYREWVRMTTITVTSTTMATTTTATSTSTTSLSLSLCGPVSPFMLWPGPLKGSERLLGRRSWVVLAAPTIATLPLLYTIVDVLGCFVVASVATAIVAIITVS